MRGSSICSRSPACDGRPRISLIVTTHGVLPQRRFAALSPRAAPWLTEDKFGTDLSKETRIFAARSRRTHVETIVRYFYSIPLLGRLVQEAAHGPASTKVLFLINCVMVWLLAIFTFGYPAIIVPALCLVAIAFVLLILITRG